MSSSSSYYSMTIPMGGGDNNNNNNNNNNNTSVPVQQYQQQYQQQYHQAPTRTSQQQQQQQQQTPTITRMNNNNNNNMSSNQHNSNEGAAGVIGESSSNYVQLHPMAAAAAVVEEGQQHHHSTTTRQQQSSSSIIRTGGQQQEQQQLDNTVVTFANADNNNNNKIDNNPTLSDNNEQEDHHSIGGDTSSVLTADGIHDVQGYCCVCLVVLVGDMCRGVFFPSMWPLVQLLNGTQITLGYSIAAFSFGRVCVNPIYGSSSYTIGYSKTIMTSICILIVATLIYGQIQNVNDVRFLIISQTFLGFGSGTLGVTRAYVADVTATRNRTQYIAYLTAVQYGGFTITPFFGSLFNRLFRDDDLEYTMFNGIIRLNMYTAPAYFMTCIAIFTLSILFIFFQDRQRFTYDQNQQQQHQNQNQKGGGGGDTTTNNASSSSNDSGSSHNNGHHSGVKTQRKKSLRRIAMDEVANEILPMIGLSVYDCCIIGCMLLNISTKGSIASFETLGIAIAEDHFQLVSSRAGVIVACCGILGVLTLLSMGHLSKRYTDVQLITFGMIIMTIGIISLVCVCDDDDQNNNNYNDDQQDDYNNNHDDEQENHNTNTNNKNPSWMYVVAIFLIYAIGYPIGHTAVIGIFSKIVGRRPQGVLMGWFSSAGSFARMIFPIMSGYIANYHGVRVLFIVLLTILIPAICFVYKSSKTMTLLSS